MTRFTRRWLWRGAVWGAATVLALIFAWKTRIGPKVGITARHGIHAGDVMAFASLYSVAFALTFRRRRRHHDSSLEPPPSTSVP